MLLRYAVMHGGLPKTESQWDTYAQWKVRQKALPECQMAKTEAGPEEPPKCDASCPLRGPGCPKFPLKT